MPSPTPETTAWLVRLRTEKEHALAELFDNYRSRLRQALRLRLGDRLTARIDPSDVLQETYLDARRRLESYVADPRVGVYGWLRRLAIDRLRKLQRKHLGTERRTVERELRLPAGSSASLAGQLLAKHPSPSQAAGTAELRRRVQHAIAQLSDDDREVILMRDFEGMSNNDVAEALGLSVSGATMRHGRALFRLKEILLSECTSEELRP
jgi:RNA polymerase sigma-70 factor (ECF subfamily)